MEICSEGGLQTLFSFMKALFSRQKHIQQSNKKHKITDAKGLQRIIHSNNLVKVSAAKQKQDLSILETRKATTDSYIDPAVCTGLTAHMEH